MGYALIGVRIHSFIQTSDDQEISAADLRSVINMNPDHSSIIDIIRYLRNNLSCQKSSYSPFSPDHAGSYPWPSEPKFHHLLRPRLQLRR
jgi:hypothetical protein